MKQAGNALTVLHTLPRRAKVMVEFLVKLRCPQTHQDCNGKRCRKQKSKGCAVQLMNTWMIDALEDLEPKFVEKLLITFDKACERKKASLSTVCNKVTENPK